jgi:hypothetical protein
LNPDKSGHGSLFYDISQSGMHHRQSGKTQGVTEQHIPEIGGSINRGGGGRLDCTRSKVTKAGWFAIRRHADIMASFKIIFLF